jgi:hypothetical protein
LLSVCRTACCPADSVCACHDKLRRAAAARRLGCERPEMVGLTGCGGPGDCDGSEKKVRRRKGNLGRRKRLERAWPARDLGLLRPQQQASDGPRRVEETGSGSPELTRDWAVPTRPPDSAENIDLPPKFYTSRHRDKREKETCGQPTRRRAERLARKSFLAHGGRAPGLSPRETGVRRCCPFALSDLGRAELSCGGWML